MRQAIRVYAIVALAAMGALTAGLWANPGSLAGGEGWLDRTLGIVGDLQLWVLPVIPLGVVAASDAARAGCRGWLALFIALIVLTPIAFWIDPLVNNTSLLFIAPCGFDSACGQPAHAPEFVILAGWVVAFLAIPIAALVYSLMPASGVAPSVETSQGERRALIASAIAGIVIMGALGYLWTSHFLQSQFGGSMANIMLGINLWNLSYMIWIVLAALPVAIASAALAHAAQTGWRGWAAGWITLAALALLTADLGSVLGGGLIPQATGSLQSSSQDLILQPYQMVSIVAPVVIMLAALFYAVTVMRPRRRAAGLAVTSL